MAAEFDISSYEAMETDTLNAGLTQGLMAEGMIVESTGPVEAKDETDEKMEEDKGDISSGIVCIATITSRETTPPPKKKRKKESDKSQFSVLSFTTYISDSSKSPV
jgi:hypothetical protein